MDRLALIVVGACLVIGVVAVAATQLGALTAAPAATPTRAAPTVIAATLAPPATVAPTAIQVTLPAVATATQAARPATATPTPAPRVSVLDGSTMGSLREIRVMADSSDTTVRMVGFGADGATVFASLGNTPNQAVAENRFQIWRRADGLSPCG